jgi:hypothetical protein
MTRTDATLAALNHAAGLLTAAGLLEPSPGDRPLAAIYALSSADHLRRAGAHARSRSVIDARAAIAEALRTLASLPDDVFDDEAVADAVDGAQDALAAARE